MRTEHRSLMLQLVFCLLMLLCSVRAYAGAKLVRMQTLVHGQDYILQLSFDKQVPFRIFQLNSPYRTVFDFSSVEWNASLPKAHGVIKSYRYGLFEVGVMRLVVGNARPLYIKAVQWHGNQLVVTMSTKKVWHYLPSYQSKDWGAQVKKLQPSSPVVHSDNRAGNHNKRTDIRGDKKPLIVIDPGHGGPDPGAIGTGGVYEKTANLEEGKTLARALLATGRYRVALTRSRDIFIPLTTRYKIAEHLNADFFISLHSDKAASPTATGATVYTLSTKASDKVAEKEAEFENQSDNVAGMNLSGYDDVVARTLLDFEQRDTMKRSWTFAEILVSHLRNHTNLTARPHRYAGFVVLKSPVVPSILLEMDFISNRNDVKRLFSKQHQQMLADRIVQSFDQYFAQLKHLNR